MLKKKRKYCPSCGVKLKVRDIYCMHCGYNFKKRKKKLSLKNIILLIALFLVLWIATRMLVGKSIIPQPLIKILGVG